MRFIVLLTGLLLSIATTLAAKNPLVLPKFVMFGDSITEKSSDSSAGFEIFGQLQNNYMRRAQLVARGFSGYNSAWAKYMVKPIYDADKEIDLITVFFGSNDAASNKQQHVPKDEFSKNLDYIVKKAKSHGTKVVVIGQGVVDETKWEDRKQKTFLQYNRAAKKVAEDNNVGFVDLWHAFMKEAGWKKGDPLPGQKGSGSGISLDKYLVDGLHFTGKGYKIYYDELVKEIKSKYPEFLPSKLEYALPNYDDINNDDIEHSLFPNGW